MLLVLAAPITFTLQQARATMATSGPANLYAAASDWLTQNSPPGSLVFQTDWDDFPHLFFYNTHNVYTAGLDPTYSELYDPKLYAEWVKITRGEVKRPGPAIRADFGAAYVLTDLVHTAFIRVASADPGCRKSTATSRPWSTACCHRPIHRGVHCPVQCRYSRAVLHDLMPTIRPDGIIQDGPQLFRAGRD